MREVGKISLSKFENPIRARHQTSADGPTVEGRFKDMEGRVDAKLPGELKL